MEKILKNIVLVTSILLSLVCIGICVYYCVLELKPEWFIFRNGDVNWIDFYNRSQQVIHRDDIANAGRIACGLTILSWLGYFIPDFIKDGIFEKEEA